MTVDQIERLQSLFTAAQAYPPEQWEAFLLRACPGDEALRREVDTLLRCQAETSDFLEEPVFERGLDLIRLATGRLRPGDVIGDCRVVSLLGVGGMGEVYLAQDAVHGRQVALKLIGQGRAEEVRGRHFRHERKVLAALNHPYIARLYDSGITPDGRAYLVMEYVEGERLDSFCQAKGLDIGERVALFRKVCAAVAYAHQNLIVHRDLKPANIRVTPEDEPKLLDFGIAKLLDPDDSKVQPDLTVTMQGLMTPEYASPEQLRGEPITTASDVYSLGVVLFELLTGQRPFAHLKGRRPDELARAICEEDPPRPSTVATRTKPASAPKSATQTTKSALGATGMGSLKWHRQLDGDLDNIVAKALQKEPGRRYASVAAFAEDLRRHGEGLTVSARKDTLSYRAGKFVRRHRMGVTAALLVFLSLLAGLAATAWQARAARQERDRAQQERDRAHLAQRQAERLNVFLETLLASADASHAGKDQKVSEVLDVAGRSLDRDLSGEPEVLAQAHGALSRSYEQLGLFEPAAKHARAALTLVRDLHGAEDPATAKAEVVLADVLTERFQWDEAEPLLRHALDVLRRQAKPDEGTLANALNSQGFYLCNHDRTAEAKPLIMEALVHAKAAWGEQSPNYVRYLTGLGNVVFGERDYAAAEPMYRRALVLEDQLAPGGEHSGGLLVNLSLALFYQDKRVEARQTLNRLESSARQLFGDKSVYTTFATYGHGVLDAAGGNYPAAIARFRQVLPLLAESYAPDQGTLVQCRAQLGLCLTRTGQAAEGEALLRTALTDGAQLDRSDFDHTFGNLESALGECLAAQNRFAEAAPMLLTGYTDLEKRLGPQNKLTVQVRERLHDLYQAWNKPAEAARFKSEATATPSPAP